VTDGLFHPPNWQILGSKNFQGKKEKRKKKKEKRKKEEAYLAPSNKIF
jgi:hypothetical protein